MRTRKEIEAIVENNYDYGSPAEHRRNVQLEAITEVLLDCRDLLQQLVASKVQHMVVVKGNGTPSPENIARIQKTVKDAQAERDGK